MNTNTLTIEQITAIATEAAVAAVQAHLAQISAPVDLTEKAAVAKPRTRKPARKAAAKKAPAKKADLTVEVLTRKGWNEAFSALVRTSGLRDARGVTLYRVSMNRWNEVTDMRNEGMTPAQAAEVIKAGKTWVRKSA